MLTPPQKNPLGCAILSCPDHEKTSLGFETKHDCQLFDIIVVMFVLIAYDNAMFNTDLWYFHIATFTMGMLQFLFSLFSPLSLEAIF